MPGLSTAHPIKIQYNISNIKCKNMVTFEPTDYILVRFLLEEFFYDQETWESYNCFTIS